MRRIHLRSRILLVSCATLILTSLIISSFVTVRALDYRYSSYERSLTNLAFTSGQMIEHATRYDAELFAGTIHTLGSSSELKSASLVDAQRRVIAHEGDTFTPPIKPEDFPATGHQILHHGQFAVYIQKLSIPSEKGTPQNIWLIAHADRTPLQDAQGEVLRTAVIIFLLTSLISIIVAQYLTSHLLTFMRSFEQALVDVKEGKEKLDLSVFQSEDLDDLEELIANIGAQMYQYRTDIRQEIEQTTQDLRETLETIEIQNVELDIARKNAIQANNAKSEFLANMSHEIRTPLNGIIGFAKMLMRSPLSAHQADTLKAIHKSSEILLMIINDILDFSKIEAGRVDLEEEALDLYELIEDIVVMLAPSAHAKGLELNYLYYSDAPAQITGDSLRLKQIITNLINNAIKFTKEGEIVLRVMLDDSLHTGKDNLKISISDTGIGLTEFERTSIFKAFSQADASTARQYGGTGLGLSICRGLVEEMKGEINFTSEQGEGSTFWFTLPIQEAATPPAKQTEIAQGGIECLVLEQQPTSRQTISHSLEYLGVNFHVAESAEALLDTVQKRNDRSKLVAMVCLNEDELDNAQTNTLFEQLKDLKTTALLFTPTLKDYDHECLSLASGHCLKPVTKSSLQHTLESALLPQNNALANAEPHKLARFTSPYKVLAVDDNDMNLALVRSLVEEMGVGIDLANSGREALEMCKDHFYPLIFMDIQMPDMDGVESLGNLRQLSRYRDEGNVIALTAFALPSEREEFIQQGFIDLITKPINEIDLENAIRKYLPEYEVDPTQEAETRDQEQASSEPEESEDYASLKVFDWDESVHLANGNTVLAKEFSEKLHNSIPEARYEIESALQDGDYSALLSSVHKLHGVTLLCGIPKLRYCAHQTEHQLKTECSIEDAQNQVEQLLRAIEELEAYFSTSDSRPITN